MSMTTTKKAADNEPFDFNLDAVKVEKDLRPFRFHFGGRRFEMTHRELLDQIPILEAAERGGDAEATLVSLRAALGDQWEDFRKLGLKGKRLEKLLKAYEEFCGAEQGESSGSTDS
jgi:hypothetical protein